MFKALKQQISDILNSGEKSFTVFDELQVEQYNSDKTWNTSKNVAVLYVNYGTVELLTGNQGLEGTLQLDLLLQVEQGVKIESLISEPLQNLIDNANGVILTEQGTNYEYELNFSLPTTDGDIRITNSGIKYLRYTLPVTVRMTNGVFLGDNANIQMCRSGGVLAPLVNVTSFVLNPNVVTMPIPKLNSNTMKSTVTAKNWKATIVAKFNPNDELHKVIYDTSNDNPKTLWTFSYILSTETMARSRTVVITDPVFTFNKGTAATMQFAVSEGE